MTKKIIKGRKYIVAGAFRTLEQKEQVQDIAQELGINILGFIFNDNTEFIEYLEPKPKPSFLKRFIKK